MLLACELIANALRHSDSAVLDRYGRPGCVTVVAMAMAETIRVEVLDAGCVRTEPRLVDTGPEAIDGRGLRLVDAMTEGRWGSWADDTGRTVWFELPTRTEGRPRYARF